MVVVDRLDVVVDIILGWRKIVVFCSVDCIGEARWTGGGEEVVVIKYYEGRGDGKGSGPGLSTARARRGSLCGTSRFPGSQPSNQAREKQASIHETSPAEQASSPVNQSTKLNQATNSNNKEQGHETSNFVTFRWILPGSPLFSSFNEAS